MDRSQQILLAVCGASSDETLITEIQDRLREAPKDYRVISISHDVLVGEDENGEILEQWTALIVLEKA